MLHRNVVHAAMILGALALAAPALAETVDTRIGRLELENGYPTKATAEKLFDEMDFQRRRRPSSGRSRPASMGFTLPI